MRRFLVLGGSSPRRQVSDLRLYEASGSDRTDGFGSIGSEPAGSGSARAPARASLAFEMSNGSDSESEVSFDLGADLETSTASCTADTEDKVELRASKSGGSSASSATENSRVDRAVEQPSGEQYTTRRIKEEKRLRAEFDRHRERTLLTMPSGKVECDICKKKPSVLRCFDCRRDGCSLCEECHGQRHDEHSAFAHVVEWKDESTGGYSRGAPDGCEYFCKPICRECGRWYQDGHGRAVVLRRFAQKRVRLAEAAKSLAEGAGHAEGSAQAWAQFGVRALGALAKCENFEGLICL